MRLPISSTGRRARWLRVLLPIFLPSIFLSSSMADEGGELFEKTIAPSLRQHCYKCHSAESEKLKGGLHLDSRAGLMLGGESGTAIEPGDAEKSLLIRAIRYAEQDVEMPPKEKLPEEIVAAFARWVQLGAPWPGATVATGAPKPAAVDIEEGRKWWAFQKPVKPAVPASVLPDARGGNEVDAFLLAKLAAKNLGYAPPADRRTLIRRATFDLIGLLPAPEEVEAFVQDSAPDAYAKVVERLLASPHYGERWGRHWLDLTRYAEDVQLGAGGRPMYYFNWRYRDWVVRAFNADLSYDRFVQMQLAGDVLPELSAHPRNEDGLTATGVLALGDWGQLDADRRKTMCDLVDDQVRLVGRVFMGVTIGCARCHDHKFDPFTTKDYYAMAGMFFSSSVMKTLGAPGDVPTMLEASIASPEESARRQAEERRLAVVTTSLEALSQERFRTAAAGGVALVPAKFESSAGAAGVISGDGIVQVSGPPGDGSYTVRAVAPAGVAVRAVKLEALADATLPASGPGRAVNGNFVLNRFALTFADAGGVATPVSLVRAQADFQQEGFPVAGAIDEKAETGWAIHPAGGRNHVAVFELDEKANVPAGAVLTFTIEHRHGDGHALGKFRLSLLATQPPVPTAGDPAQAALIAEREALTASVKVPLPAVHSVREGGQPETEWKGIGDTRVQVRGSYLRLGEIAPRAFPAVLAGDAPPAIAEGSSGRRELARWLASPEHPLTARVMVNRLWQHHFGEGLVRTPGNFGKLGRAPTHPELLDWLAVKFVESGWSMKAMHRLIMTSAAYQQSSVVSAEATQRDAANELLSHFPRRRMEMEGLRDNLLAVSGALDRTLGGPSVDEQDCVRRMIYIFRWRQNETLIGGMRQMFDAPDPKDTTEQRGESTVAPQALFMMNSAFVAQQAARLAERVKASAPDDRARVDWLHRVLFSRPARDAEIAQALDFLAVTKGDWTPLCHALLSANEFLYLD